MFVRFVLDAKRGNSVDGASGGKATHVRLTKEKGLNQNEVMKLSQD